MSGAEGSRDALLIATGLYDDPSLRTLRSPGQDCAGLAEVLSDPLIGGFRTEQMVDMPAHQVTRALERFFRDRSRNDLLLLHLSCHGLKDDDGHLHFAARDTDKSLPASTAIPAAFLHDRMARCRARTIVVLLDCCYSGAFLPGAKGDDQVHLRDELSGHGRAILTATNRTEYAWEGDRLETMAPQPSRFTGALIKGLRSGAADLNGDGRITVTELYDYVYEELHRSAARQSPRMWAELEYQVTIARVAPASPETGVPTGTAANARAVGPEVHPMEIAGALQRECDMNATVRDGERTVAPNDFVVEMSARDHEHLSPRSGQLGDELCALVRDYAQQQRYTFMGPIRVHLEKAVDLDAGMFRVRTRTLASSTSQGVPGVQDGPLTAERPQGGHGYPPAAAPPMPDAADRPPVAPPDQQPEPVAAPASGRAPETGGKARAEAPATDSATGSFSDIMDAFFGSKPSQPPPQVPRTRSPRGQDALISLDVTLEEAALGALKEIQVDTAVVCSACTGLGAAPGSVPVVCTTCSGTGQSTAKRSLLGKAVKGQDCSRCNGFGTLLPRLCRDCRGDGRLRSRRTLTVQVPAGVDSGIRIQLAGEGEAGPRGGAAGDLYAEIRMLPDARFQRRGDDLHTTVRIPRELAQSGGTTQVDTLNGRKTIKVPPGTPTGRTLKLHNFGMTQLGGGGRGDLLVRLEVI